MKHTYPLTQQFIARVLIISLFLQSCDGFSNLPNLIQKQAIGEDKESTKQLEFKHTGIVDKELTAAGGYVVTLYEEADGGVNASVELVDEKNKVYNGVPIVIEKGAELASLARLPKKIQQSHIHIQLAQGNQPAKVVICKKAGLVGGGDSEDEGEEEGTYQVVEERIEEIVLDDREVPNGYFCPITHEIMIDPVIAADNHTYERAAIQYWFTLGHRTSPLTNEIIPNIELRTNHALRNTIEESMPSLTKKKLEMRHIEAAIRLREEEIEATLELKANLINEEKQKVSQLEQQLVETDQKTSQIPLSDADINQLVDQAKEGDEEALIRIVQLSKTNHAHAQYKLGIMYGHGWGVSKSDRKAFEWFQRAANQGLADAQYALGFGTSC